MIICRRCLDCGIPVSYAAIRCAPCEYQRRRAAPRPVVFVLPVGAPTLRDYPGQPALSCRYTPTQLHNLGSMICARGTWRPASWHQPLAAWMAELPA